MGVEPFRVAAVADTPPGSRVVVTVNGAEIGLFNVDGKYHALRNKCPHEGAPLCLGKITGTTRADAPYEYEWLAAERVVRCPWHGWEFDVETGKSFAEPGLPAKRYETEVRDGQVYVYA